MVKAIKSVVLVVAVFAFVTAAVELFTPSVSAASNCWRVDCNTCCKLPKGGVVCTQRACV